MSGYEVATRVRANEAWNAVVIVAITGFGHEVDRVRAASIGIDAP